MGELVMLIETSEPLLAVQAVPVDGIVKPALTNPTQGMHIPGGGTWNFVPTNVRVPAKAMGAGAFSVMQKSGGGPVSARAVDQLKVTASKLRATIQTPVFIASSNRVCGTHSGVTAEGVQFQSCLRGVTSAVTV